MNNIIIKAIEERKKLRVNYNGGWRTIQPYCYGVSTTGNDSLRAYQEEGYSREGKHTDWKFMTVGKIADIEQLDEVFTYNHPQYKRYDKMIPTIYKQI